VRAVTLLCSAAKIGNCTKLMWLFNKGAVSAFIHQKHLLSTDFAEKKRK
jgi:hypothetical protein